MSQDFRDLLSAFLEGKVKFLVVGAYAVAAHSTPRATGDLDVWVAPGRENGGRVYRALARFGAALEGITESDFATEGTVFQIGVVPRRIDLVTSITGVEFERAWPNRVEAKIFQMSVPVIGLDDLIRNKKAVGRHRDLADVEVLERFPREKR